MRQPEVSTKVESILKSDERARNDDKWLCYSYWSWECKKRGKQMFIPYDMFAELPPFESITRARRKIQNEEKRYLPTEKIGNRRANNESEFREYYGGGL